MHKLPIPGMREMIPLPILQLLKGERENIINNFMPINWANSLKDTNYQATQEVSNLNSRLFIKETEFLVKTVYTNKSQGPDGFTVVNYSKHLGKK